MNKSSQPWLWMRALELLAFVFVFALGRPTRIVAADPPGGLVPKANFFVSPRGNDQWSGHLAEPAGNDGPFATIVRARDAARALHQAQPERGIRVVLRGGVYHLDSPLEFEPEDSGTPQAPIVYTAAKGEKPVLSGGRRLTNGRWGEANGHKAWTIELPEVKAGRWNFRQLFVNGDRRPRTRLPQQGEYRIKSLPGYNTKAGGYEFLKGTRQFIYDGTDIQPWRNLHDVEIIGFTRWIDNRLPLAQVDAAQHTVTFDRASLFALSEISERPSVYRVENVFEALDTPGQWYLDRPSGRLFCLPRPGEDLASAEIIAPRLPQVVRFVGRPDATVHDLQLEGLTFAHTEWQPPPDWTSSLQAAVDVPGAIGFDYAERCRVTKSMVEHVGTYGLEVGVGCADLEFTHNRLTDLGAGGIKIGHFFSYEPNERGKQREAAMPKGPRSRRITVTDNVIAHGGRWIASGVGVFVGDNPECRITHNHIFDLYYSGISVGSVQDFGPSQATNNVVEHNHIHDVGQSVLSDLAGIYTCSTPGSRIAFNVIHDVQRRDYGGWGIYTDEGSHDLLIRNNLVYRCQDGALFGHHSRAITAENNIFALGRAAQIDRGGIGGFELNCRRNLIYFNEGKAVGDYGNGHWGRDVCAFDRNLYWNASAQPMTFGNMTLSEWQAAGQDQTSVITDPQFVDPAHGDFNLKAGSGAAQIGFEPWDLSAVGPRPE